MDTKGPARARVPVANALDDSTRPKSWVDLTNVRYKNKLTFANPRVSGTGAAVVSAAVQNFGWSYWEKIADLKPLIAAGHPAMVSSIIAGERTVGPMLDYSIVAAKEKKQPIGFVFPTEGAIAVAAYVGVTSGTKVPDDAKKFADFYASKEAAEILQVSGMYHARVDAQPPEGWPPISQIKTLPIDWDKHRTAIEEIKRKFADLMER